MRTVLRAIIRYSLLATLHCAAYADAPRDLITRGNALYGSGQYAEALKLYEQATEAPDPALAAELLHNRAAAHFKLGQADDARELWVRAASLKDATFEAAARYNLGNCDYGDALKMLQSQNSQGALELLDRAAQQYRDAIRLDPHRADARANLELARLLKKQIEEQATSQPQSQPQSQPGQPQQKQEDQSSASQPSTQPQQDTGEAEQQPRTQPTSQPQPPEPQSQPAAESQPAATQPQTPPESQPAEAQPPPAEEAESQPAEPQPPIPIEMTRAEAERLLQKVRDFERARRRELARREAAGYEPVQRDW